MSEQIVTGKKYRILTDVAQKVWQRVSFWTKSSDVEFNDGKTAETKVGAISGITDSLVSTSSNIAASAKAVSELNGNLNKINVYVGGDGKLHFVNSGGADSALNFSSYPYPEITISGYGSDAGTTITKPYGYNYIRCNSVRNAAYIHLDGSNDASDRVYAGSIINIASASTIQLDFTNASFTIYK